MVDIPATMMDFTQIVVNKFILFMHYMSTVCALINVKIFCNGRHYPDLNSTSISKKGWEFILVTLWMCVENSGQDGSS